MNTLDLIMAIEDGGFDTEEEFLNAVVTLANDGILFKLQGFYQRMLYGLVSKEKIRKNESGVWEVVKE